LYYIKLPPPARGGSLPLGIGRAALGVAGIAAGPESSDAQAGLTSGTLFGGSVAWMVVATTNYSYELRRGESITATGRISYETVLSVGDPITIGTSHGVVRAIGPRHRDGEVRLLIELVPDDPQRPRTARG
jgi:hypothetical protein